MTHRRQTIREAAADAIAGLPVTVVEEQAARIAPGDRPLIVVRALTETVEAGEGTMHKPHDRRNLALTFEIHTAAKTGLLAVDAVNDIDEAVGVALGAAADAGAFDALLVDLRWADTAIELAQDQELYLAAGTITYAAVYDAYYGAPS